MLHLLLFDTSKRPQIPAVVPRPPPAAPLLHRESMRVLTVERTLLENIGYGVLASGCIFQKRLLELLEKPMESPSKQMCRSCRNVQPQHGKRLSLSSGQMVRPRTQHLRLVGIVMILMPDRWAAKMITTTPSTILMRYRADPK
jgi:hypothetical protein